MTQGNKDGSPNRIAAVIAFFLLIPTLIIVYNKYTERQNTIESHRPSVSQYERKKRHPHARLKKQHNPSATQAAQKTDDHRRTAPAEEAVKTTEAVTEAKGYSTDHAHAQTTQPDTIRPINDHKPTISIVQESEKWARDNANGTIKNMAPPTQQASITRLHDNINTPVETTQIKPVIWFGDPKKRNTNNYE